jgi:F0F1-type ATP synthase alpha subunit
MVEQVVVLYALSTGHMDHLMPQEVDAYQKGLTARLREHAPGLIAELIERKDLTDSVKEGLNEQLRAYGRGAL